MAYININGCNTYYEITGNGAETIVFLHGLLWSGDMYRAQVQYFKDHYRCVTYDFRGQGRSQVTDSGYDMESLYEDAVSFITQLNLAPCHFVGLSMGGFIAMRLAARRPDLLKSMILLETSADAEPNVFKYNMLSLIVKLFGVKAVSQKVMTIMFGQSFLNDNQRSELRDEWTEKLNNNPKTITRAVQGVIDRKPVFEELRNITLPSLIIVGEEDVATVPDKAKRIHSQIPRSVLHIIARAGHSATVEEPAEVNKRIDEFLNQI